MNSIVKIQKCFFAGMILGLLPVLMMFMSGIVCYGQGTGQSVNARQGDNAGDVVLVSPDGKLEMVFKTIEERIRNSRRQGGDNAGAVTHKLVYEINYSGKPFITSSAMGLELKDNNRALGFDVSVDKHISGKGEDNYKLLHGRASSVSEKYNSVILELSENNSGRKMNVEARAYNDAIAFRYMVPEQSGLDGYNLKSEKTEFRLAKDATTYAQILPNFRSSYESEFYKTPATALANQGGVKSEYLVGLPLVMDMPGVGWAAITEANMEGNSSIYLTNPSGSWSGYWFEAVVSPGITDPEISVKSSLPHNTAWRVISIVSEPTRLIETNILTNLNPDCRIKDTSWIMTGKSAWDWWCGSLNKEGKSDYSTANMKYYIDFAAESGLEFMTVDAGWSTNDITEYREHINIPEIVEYARTKGIKVFIWAFSDYVRDQMDKAFPLYEKWGVAGVKIDFILRDDQEGIDFYYKVAEKAAKHKLMIDFHGGTKPWGIQRTYPNVVGYESVLGMEQSKAGSRDEPYNHLIIPFTRMIGGLVDYTPGGFENTTREDFMPRSEQPMVMGTRAHHLAAYVIYESPFQMVSDWPEKYKNDPSFEFIKKVPTKWDETKALNGIPGEYVTIARRSGKNWYIGAMTNWTEREYEISLDFLGNGNYTAEIYEDAPDSGKFPKKNNIRKIKVTRNSKLPIKMVSGGGIAINVQPT